MSHEIDTANERQLIATLLRREDYRAEILDEVDEEHFGNSRHKVLMRAIVALFGKGQPIDDISVNETIASQEGSKICPPSYVAEVMALPGTDSKHRSVSERIRRQAAFRALQLEAQRVLEKCFSNEGDPWELAHKLSVTHADISAGKRGDELKSLVDAHKKVLQRMDDARSGKTFGISTGLSDVDAMTGGLKPGEMTVIAAESSMGKSALAFTVASNVAADGNPVLFGSLEMSDLQIGQRDLSMRTGISAQKLLQPLGKNEYASVFRASSGINKTPFFFIDRPGLRLSDIRGEARSCARRHGLSLLVVDYLQLMEGSGRYGNRETDVAEVSRGLKHLSVELNIPILALSQVNRNATKRSDRRPILTDMRESAAIVNDADNVWMIYREDYENPNANNTGEAEIWIRKQRNGPTGVVHCRYLHERMKFANQRRIA